MDDAQRWLTVAADVLNEPDPFTAEELLVLALRRWGHAYLTVRTETSPAPQPEVVEFFPGPEWRDSPAWASAVHDAAFDQPLYAYNVSTRTDQPATLEGVVAQGWGLSERAVDLMEQLGFTRHQMTIPLALNHHGARDAYALVSESPYTDADLARAAAIQALVTGLDSHIRHLAAAAQLACAAPDPTAVHLTPRERVVLDHIARGATVDGIAARLRISRRTVHKHQEHLYRKLGAVDRLSAVLSAQRLGLVKAPER
jgi:ATP/maltotriose-dependent transcriptional regulator MalT